MIKNFKNNSFLLLFQRVIIWLYRRILKYFSFLNRNIISNENIKLSSIKSIFRRFINLIWTNFEEKMKKRSNLFSHEVNSSYQLFISINWKSNLIWSDIDLYFKSFYQFLIWKEKNLLNLEIHLVKRLFEKMKD